MSDPKKRKKTANNRPDPMPSIAPSTAQEGMAQQETLPLQQPVLQANPASAVLGETFGKYRILRLLGSGGMCAVYLAHDPVLERDVALKVPHTAARSSPESLERFYREARSAGRLQHPNICPAVPSTRSARSRASPI
jgi:serine/threonine protein kinase